jgi:hypothetical protein
MKKICLFVLLICLVATQGVAQSSKSKSKSKKKEKESVSLKEKLWYGGSFALGFNGQNGESVFQFGLAPMVGYKFTPWLSAGPRIAPTYLSYKAATSFGNLRASWVDFEAGLFVRAKVFGSIYLQGEGDRRSFGGPDGTILPNNRLRIQRSSRTDYLIGGGYSQGAGGWGSDISVLYNVSVANDVNTFESPLVFRFGLTYNF